MELESSVLERDRVAKRLAQVTEDGIRSRKTFAARLGDPDTVARTGALLELERAGRLHTEIRPQLEKSESDLERIREQFLATRTGRRQVEALLDREEEAAREATVRRAQQMLDDWYGRRRPPAPALHGKPQVASRGESALPDISLPSDASPRSLT